MIEQIRNEDNVLITNLRDDPEPSEPFQARLSVFDYIEVFYNRQRRHSSLDYQAPLLCEMKGN